MPLFLLAAFSRGHTHRQPRFSFYKGIFALFETEAHDPRFKYKANCHNPDFPICYVETRGYNIINEMISSKEC